MNPMQRWANRPLAIRPEALGAILQVDALAPDASRFAGAQRQGDVFRVTPGGVAIVSVVGALINRGAVVGEHYGFSTYEALGFKLETAARNEKVRSIIIDFDTPGGEAAGAFELATTIRKISSEKPVFASVNSMAASAGYALASAARAIISTPSGLSGAIGVVLAHMDISRALDTAGVGVTLIHSGSHKTDGNPYEPLSDAVKADLQAEVGKFYSLFIDCVAAGRGRRLSAKAAKATEARTFIGQAALEAGLVDQIGTFAELLEQAEKRAARTSPGRSGATKMAVNLSAFEAEYDRNPTAAAIAQKPTAAAYSEDELVAKLNGSRPERAARKEPADPELAALVDATPRQAGAVSWAEIVAELNGEAGKARGGRHL